MGQSVPVKHARKLLVHVLVASEVNILNGGATPVKVIVKPALGAYGLPHALARLLHGRVVARNLGCLPCSVVKQQLQVAHDRDVHGVNVAQVDAVDLLPRAHGGERQVVRSKVVDWCRCSCHVDRGVGRRCRDEAQREVRAATRTRLLEASRHCALTGASRLCAGVAPHLRYNRSFQAAAETPRGPLTGPRPVDWRAPHHRA